MSQAKFLLAGAFALILSACAASVPAAPASGVRQITSTTSFGMCVGYCTTRLEITEGQAVLVREARGGRGGPSNLPEQRYQATLTAAEWQDIERAASGAALSGLPEVIGCPDCADGGAESLTITRTNQTQTVTFEHGAAIAQAQPLLDRVRALRERLTPAQQ